MVEKTCMFCKQRYFVDTKDDIDICHECYCALFDKNKSIDSKIKYLKQVKKDLKILDK